MVDNHSTFGHATVLAAVVVAAVAVLAYRPGMGSIALNAGPSVSVSNSPSYRQGDGPAVNQLATFWERWTSTTEPSGNKP